MTFKTIIILYLTVWNVGFADIPELEFVGGIPTTILRWGAVLLCLAVIQQEAMADRNGKGLVGYTILGMLLALPSVIHSNDIYISILEFVRYTSVVGLGIISLRRCAIEDVIDAIYKVFSVITTLSLIFIFLKDPFILITAIKALYFGERLREAGVAMHANNLGFVSAILAIVSTVKILLFHRNIIVNYFFILAGISGVVLSGSRASIFMLLIAMIVGTSSIFFSRDKKLSNRNRLCSYGFMALVYGVVILVQILPLRDLFDPYILVELSSDDSYEASNLARLSLWNNAWASFLNNPISGNGFGLKIVEGFSVVLGDYIYAPYAHNAVLNAMSTGGVLLLLLLLFILWVGSKALAIGLCYIYRNKNSASLVQFEHRINILIVTILVSTCFIVSSVDGCLQGNYGMSAVFALAVGALFSAISPQRAKMIRGENINSWEI